MRWINRIARTVLGIAVATFIGIYAVAGQKPAPGWRLAVLIAGGMAILCLLLSEPALVARRRTIHIGSSSEGGARIWREAAEKPLFARQRVERKAADKEIEVGRRAIRVGADVLAAYRRARAAVSAVEAELGNPSPWDDKAGWQATQEAYQGALNDIKVDVGAAWSEVLADLDSLSVKPQFARDVSVNYTGLDSEATDVQAAGRVLLRKHGIDPDASEQQPRISVLRHMGKLLDGDRNRAPLAGKSSGEARQDRQIGMESDPPESTDPQGEE